jgi:hypothetical protein
MAKIAFLGMGSYWPRHARRGFFASLARRVRSRLFLFQTSRFVGTFDAGIPMLTMLSLDLNAPPPTGVAEVVDTEL